MTYIKLAENKKPGDNSEIGFYDVEIKVFLQDYPSINTIFNVRFFVNYACGLQKNDLKAPNNDWKGDGSWLYN